MSKKYQYPQFDSEHCYAVLLQDGPIHPPQFALFEGEEVFTLPRAEYVAGWHRERTSYQEITVVKLSLVELAAETQEAQDGQPD